MLDRVNNDENERAPRRSVSSCSMAFVIVRLGRRELVWINVTTSPTAERIARQITEAFPWDERPRYLIRDRDRIYGAVVARRLRVLLSAQYPQA